jgi:ABC-type uncharacterized transport system substrate-binding protein
VGAEGALTRRLRRSGSSLAAAGALVTALAGPLAAHPHIWIDHHVTMLMGPAGAEGVRFTWEFDPLFSSLIFQEFDANRDRTFAPDEVRQIESKHLANLKAYDYFVEIKIEGEAIPIAVKDFQASVGSNGQVTYAFTVPVKAPAPAGSLEIAVYDPTYYTAFALRAMSPVTVQSPRQYRADCKVVTDPGSPSGETVTCAYRRIVG